MLVWKLSLYYYLGVTASRSNTARAFIHQHQLQRAASPFLTSSSSQAQNLRITMLSTSKTLFSTSTKKSGLSPRVLETLDPCVVLMKELIGKYAHLWADKGGIFSLAQGVVYWEPPSTCQEALKVILNKPDKETQYNCGILCRQIYDDHPCQMNSTFPKMWRRC
jgi:hypothetical protein